MKINDGQARYIAMAWHSGMWSPLYSFGSCGAIDDRAALRKEISVCIAELLPDESNSWLLALDKYVRLSVDGRAPIAGWPAGWDETPPTSEQTN